MNDRTIWYGKILKPSSGRSCWRGNGRHVSRRDMRRILRIRGIPIHPYRTQKEVSHLYFMIDPDLLRLEKMMVLIPRFTPPGAAACWYASPRRRRKRKAMAD